MPARKKAPETAAEPKKASPRKRTTEKTIAAKTTRKKAAPVAETAVASAPKARVGSTSLVIVESPAKAKTINKYLGPGFKVLASYGHVRDLVRGGRRLKGEEVVGVKIAEGWLPRYVVQDKQDSKGKGGKGGARRTPRDILNELGKEAEKAAQIFLATDPDREGEAIAWHIEDELHLPEDRTFRITFNEITKPAVQRAISSPGKIDMDRVRAQEARRMLDRVVGYPLSDLLGDKVARGLSAGRVQSVAVRLIVDREREIQNFKQEEYWKVIAHLDATGPQSGTVPAQLRIVKKTQEEKAAKEGGPEEEHGPDESSQLLKPEPNRTFLAELAEWAGQKFAATNEDQASTIARQLLTAAYTVTKVEQKDRPEKAPPPFTTSTLQQQANIRHGFAAQRTMRAAQKLYEGVDLGSEGQVALITYMRTDSTRVSEDALRACRDHINQTFGPAYLPASPNRFASGKSAQEAHEAIRPTDLKYTPEMVEQQLSHSIDHRQDLVALYRLIYRRFVASQMNPAIFAITNVEVKADCGLDKPPQGASPLSPTPVSGEPQAKGSVPSALFKAQGKILKFDGYRRVLAPKGKQEDATLPALREQQALGLRDLLASQHFTQPPPRYNEASLVKMLEKEGIGRPSTYATIIHKIQEKKYVEQRERRFYATDLGMKVTDLLVQHFPRVMDLKFTSQMEEELDQIEGAKLEWHAVLNQFWAPFNDALKAAVENMQAVRGEETGEACPKCSRPLVIKYTTKGDGSKFISCSGYPECKYVKPRPGEPERPEPEETEFKCPNCDRPLIKRMGRRGPFLGCSGYPECKTIMNLDAEGKPVLAAKPTEHLCSKCGKPMVLREGPRGPFLGCSGYPKCRNLVDVDAEGNPVKPVDTGIPCEKCGAPMTIKRGPRGPFLGCSAYPKCRSTKPMTDELKEKFKDQLPAARQKKTMPQVEIKETCPECGAPMELRQGRRGYFLGCTQFSKTKCKGSREVTPEILEQIQEGAVSGG